MRTIIAGGRDYWLTPEDMRFLDVMHMMHPITEVLCGMQSGADAGGFFWSCWRLGKEPRRFPADWRGLGRMAGPLRNQRMVDLADALIVFPGGRGSDDVTRRARMKGILVIQRVEETWNETRTIP